MKKIIKLKDVSKQYVTGNIRTYAVKDINLSISSGEYISIEGLSGSGKSTLLNIIGLFSKPSTGSVIAFDNNVNELSLKKLAFIRNKYLGFVFQNFNLIGDLTISDNVSLPLKYAGKSKEERKEISNYWMQKLGIEKRANHFPSQLSGGQQQRVAIARAMVNDPEIIFADEPTGNLDKENTHVIIDLFNEINDDGKTLCVVTHSSEVSKQASKKLIIENGFLKHEE